ncbi:unnamed protein product [Rotaria magnacalcarata]|uniref:NAD(P)(+)--arginine ADP-ribosyltransferase n=1 Tax=Rotaria magnacalcarata TaxID=392030 RepID=A0A815U8F2_9BILA|nr:unnamed protein product [Rotaria magnacalcarata]CAF1683724.1 unnamed protein product [Rotaria magnacalcarata]
MDQAISTSPNFSKCVKWMWQSNSNPWSKSEPAEWSYYSDVGSLIIEGAYLNNQTGVLLDGYFIDFKHKVQIDSSDANKQRPVKRLMRKREDQRLREERFMFDPISPKRPFGGEYGWISPLILQLRKDLCLKKMELPSKDERIVQILVEKAVLGIIEEGKQIGKQQEAEKLAKLLGEKKDKGMKEVWKCCAYIYSLESFLYKKLNEVMRLIGDDEQEQVWRSKVHTLGPFCLLLWDDPFNTVMKTEKILYRGANLTNQQIATYEEMAACPEEHRSFQAFTSCSRNREKAEQFGNTLFIMEILFTFILDISELSEYPDEEEELITPGVCFNVRLRQRFNACLNELHRIDCLSDSSNGFHEIHYLSGSRRMISIGPSELVSNGRYVSITEPEIYFVAHNKDELKKAYDPAATIDEYRAAIAARDRAADNLTAAAAAAIDARRARSNAYAAIDDANARGIVAAALARGNLADLATHRAAAAADTAAADAAACALRAAAAARVADVNRAAAARLDADRTASAAEKAKRAAQCATHVAADRLSDDTLAYLSREPYGSRLHLGLVGIFNVNTNGLDAAAAFGLYGLNEVDYNLDDVAAACNALDATDDVNLSIAFNRDGDIIDSQ